jgi:peptidoglycan-associated lipoprotein
MLRFPGLEIGGAAFAALTLRKSGGRRAIHICQKFSRKGFKMFKKLFCLMAVMVLVSACDSMGLGDGSGSGSGNGGYGSHNANVTPGSPDDLVVNVGDRVFFSLNGADLSSEARGTLDRQATWLKKYPNVSVTVEGHCDERGTREYNLALGERRATAVKNYLVAGGVSASRVKTISYGKERPAVLGSNEQAWAQNRRGVTVVNQ